VVLRSTLKRLAAPLLGGLALAAAAQPADAGGLLLPGSGAVSTSRAGAAVASTEDGEALSINRLIRDCEKQGQKYLDARFRQMG